jgi:hypothetical protein
MPQAWRTAVPWSARAFYQRVWQLYVAHVFLFMMFMAMVAYTVGALNNSLYAEEFGAANFLNELELELVKVLMLQFQPAFIFIWIGFLKQLFL